MIEGVAMNAPIKDARPPGGFRRIAGPVARVLIQAVFLLAGLATTVLGFTWFVEGYDVVGAYRHAPVCGTAAATPGTDCLLHETGKVTARFVHRGEEDSYELTVARETAPERDHSVGKAFYDAAQVGVDVDLSVFRGRVVELSYRGHRAEDMITPWLTAFKVALLAGLGSALTAQGAAWWRSGLQALPFGIAVFVVFSAFFVALLLMSAQWPLAVTLGVPALGWLVLTAGSAAGAMGED
ncbi:hypothetical protein [Kitasatospora sp. A2-31]|uniref:hypothetical protein n=1 Tax=Kitasatospora sp. A2-31 TaxID=2916414 RepID=UPI001EEB8AF5|nr:hypothetical protein [Kitasatospora sp. A2-31]MCG6494126.1 hypothetical protein [Kitasatospora sp. A2-31]